jgi:hypothetical protein
VPVSFIRTPVGILSGYLGLETGYPVSGVPQADITARSGLVNPEEVQQNKLRVKHPESFFHKIGFMSRSLRIGTIRIHNAAASRN